MAEIDSTVQTVYYIFSAFGAAGAAVAAYCRSLHNKLDQHTADLAAFKVQVANEYPSTARFDSMTREITAAIRDLGNRIDALFHRDSPHHS